MRKKKSLPLIPRGIMLAPHIWSEIEAIAAEQRTSIGSVVRGMVNESIANKKLAQN